MTRETKVGMGMAGAFLALVGGVLGYKMWSGNPEEDAQASVPPPALQPEEEPKKPAATNPKPAPPFPAVPDPKGALAKNDLPVVPPPLDPPGDRTKPPAFDPIKPPPIDPPSGPPPIDPPGKDPLKPPPIDPQGGDPLKPPPFDPLGPPPLDIPGEKESKKPVGPPPLDIPGEKDPKKPVGPPPIDPPGGDPLKPPTIDPMKPPKVDDPRVKIEFPDVPPIDPPSKYDRTYPSPKPKDPEKPLGVPITIKEQPDHVYAPPSQAGSPLVPKDNWAGTKGTVDTAKPSPNAPLVKAQVEKFDVELYRPKAGDTYASISQAAYKTDKYEQALAAFNRERDTKLVEPQPGRPVHLPPAEQLEKRYPSLIPGYVAPPNKGVIAKNEPPDVEPTKFKPTEPKEKPKADAAKLVNEKQYKVRQNDTIWTVAKRTLGNGDRWPEILRMNKEALKDVNQLQAGMILKLPGDAKLDGIE